MSGVTLNYPSGRLSIDVTDVPSEWHAHLELFVKCLERRISPSFVVITPDEIGDTIAQGVEDEIYQPLALEIWNGMTADQQWSEAAKATEEYDSELFRYSYDTRTGALDGVIDALGSEVTR